MAQHETRRLSPTVRRDDLDCYNAIAGISGYEPMNESLDPAHLLTARNAMQAADAAEVNAEAAWKAARDAANSKEWAFHNLLLSAKDQVIAQFGDDSDQAQAVGLKKKSEYKPRSRNGHVAPTPA